MKHILCRHQRNDANVVKGLSIVSLVNLLSGTGFNMFGRAASELSIISISVALVLYLAPMGEELNKNSEYLEA